MTGAQLLTLAAVVVVGVLAGLGVVDGDAALAFLFGAVLPGARSLEWDTRRPSRDDDQLQEDDHT